MQYPFTTHTILPQPLLKPIQPHDNNPDINEPEIRNDRKKVYRELLVRLEGLDINTKHRNVPKSALIKKKRMMGCLFFYIYTHVFSPDSVVLLHPKKKASIADKLP